MSQRPSVPDRLTEGPLTRVSRLTDLGVLRTIAHNTIEHGLSSAASAMAFDIFLGMIPLLALMGAIAGSFARSGKNVAFELRFLDVAPGPAAELARSHLARFETGTSFAPLVIMGFLWLSSSAAHVGSRPCAGSSVFRRGPIRARVRSPWRSRSPG